MTFLLFLFSISAPDMKEIALNVPSVTMELTTNEFFTDNGTRPSVLLNSVTDNSIRFKKSLGIELSFYIDLTQVDVQSISLWVAMRWKLFSLHFQFQVMTIFNDTTILYQP